MARVEITVRHGRATVTVDIDEDIPMCGGIEQLIDQTVADVKRALNLQTGDQP